MLPSFSRFKTPKHQQFKIVTRYYDQEKEERETRLNSIRETEGRDTQTASSINFKRPTKSKSSLFSGSFLQMTIAVVLIFVVFGWMEFGSKVFYYAMWLILPIYAIYRLKSLKKNK